MEKNTVDFRWIEMPKGSNNAIGMRRLFGVMFEVVGFDGNEQIGSVLLSLSQIRSIKYIDDLKKFKNLTVNLVAERHEKSAPKNLLTFDFHERGKHCILTVSRDTYKDVYQKLLNQAPAIPFVIEKIDDWTFRFIFQALDGSISNRVTVKQVTAWINWGVGYSLSYEPNSRFRQVCRKDLDTLTITFASQDDLYPQDVKLADLRKAMGMKPLVIRDTTKGG